MNILFICNGNVARSQEAEVFFNSLTQKHHATSAGVNAEVGRPIDPLVNEAMKEAGYSVKGCIRKLVDKDHIENADLVVSFKPYGELPSAVQQHQNIRYWDISDPRRQSIEFHRKIRDQVTANVQKLIEEIK
jgi:protein-tyrosine-phosphatase